MFIIMNNNDNALLLLQYKLSSTSSIDTDSHDFPTCT